MSIKMFEGKGNDIISYQLSIMARTMSYQSSIMSMKTIEGKSKERVAQLLRETLEIIDEHDLAPPKPRKGKFSCI